MVWGGGGVVALGRGLVGVAKFPFDEGRKGGPFGNVKSSCNSGRGKLAKPNPKMVATVSLGGTWGDSWGLPGLPRFGESQIAGSCGGD